MKAQNKMKDPFLNVTFLIFVAVSLITSHSFPIHMVHIMTLYKLSSWSQENFLTVDLKKKRKLANLE